MTNVFRKTSGHLRTLTIAGDGGNVETIKTTDEHPFYVQGQGWTDAGSLRAGDLLQEPDGSWQGVLFSAREEHPGGFTVYNLEVQGHHTYFVEDGLGAADAVWVHNRCVGQEWIAKGPGGKPVRFDHAEEVQFFKRSHVDYNTIKTDFDKPGGRRDQWLESIGLNPNTRTQLEAAGMTPSQIDWMVNSQHNKLPSGWQVHHKKGIKLGGDNEDDNLMIFRAKDDFYHKALTNEQGEILRQIEDEGGTIERAFPMFNGKVIFTDAD